MEQGAKRLQFCRKLAAEHPSSYFSGGFRENAREELRGCGFPAGSHRIGEQVYGRSAPYASRNKYVSGEMAEWLKAHAWKACLLERVTWPCIRVNRCVSLSDMPTVRSL